MQMSLENRRVLITAGAGGIGRVMCETFVEAGATGSHLRCRRRCNGGDRTHAGCQRQPVRRLRSRPGRSAVRRCGREAGRARHPGQQRRHRGPNRQGRGHQRRRLAAVHRDRPERHVLLHTPRGTDAQGSRWRQHHQPVLRCWTARVSLPHTLRSGQVGRGRIHQEPVDGGRHRQHPRECHSARCGGRRSHQPRDRREGTGPGDQLRGAARERAGARVDEDDGVSARDRRHGVVSGK